MTIRSKNKKNKKIKQIKTSVKPIPIKKSTKAIKI